MFVVHIVLESLFMDRVSRTVLGIAFVFRPLCFSLPHHLAYFVVTRRHPEPPPLVCMASIYVGYKCGAFSLVAVRSCVLFMCLHGSSGKLTEDPGYIMGIVQADVLIAFEFTEVKHVEKTDNPCISWS